MPLSRKNRIKAIVYSRFTLGILLVLCILLAMSVYEGFSIERDMHARRAVVEAELQALHEREALLEEKVDYLNDERGVEAEIRKHFDVAREGEQVVVLVDKQRPTPSTSSTSLSDTPKNNSFWSIE